MRIPSWSILVTALAAAPSAAADLARCEADTADRIRFLEERLDARRGYARWWWSGWTSAYGLGTVIQGVRAGIEDDRGRQADYAVSAAKAAFGTTRLLLAPPTARAGADPMRAIDPVDDAACRERLAAGQAALRASAHESRSRWSWKRHAANVAINVAGGVIVAEGFDESRGWTSAAVGIAVGELMTFSHPWTGDDDLADYERRFAGVAAGPRVTVSIAPWLGGARLHVAF